MARSRESVARGEGKGQVSVVRAESTVVCGEEEVSAGSGSINIEGAGARRKEARGSEQEGKGVASKKGKSKDVRMESRDLMIQCGECSAWKNVNQVEEVHCMSSEQIEALEFTCRSCLMSEVAALKLHIAELSKCECNKALREIVIVRALFHPCLGGRGREVERKMHLLGRQGQGAQKEV